MEGLRVNDTNGAPTLNDSCGTGLATSNGNDDRNDRPKGRVSVMKKIYNTKKDSAIHNANEHDHAATPGYLKRSRIPKFFCSPTDNVFSPITKNLMRPGANPVAVAAAGAANEAVAAVMNAQTKGQGLNFDLADNDDECVGKSVVEDESEEMTE